MLHFATAIQHYNGTATATPTAISFRNKTRWMLVDNTAASTDMQISFDGGTTYKTVGAGVSLGVNIYALASLYVKTAAGSATYEIIIGVYT